MNTPYGARIKELEGQQGWTPNDLAELSVLRHKQEGYMEATNLFPDLVAACEAALNRLSAWSDGARVARESAEMRMDARAAQGFENQRKNYGLLIDQLEAALAKARVTP